MHVCCPSLCLEQLRPQVMLGLDVSHRYLQSPPIGLFSASLLRADWMPDSKSSVLQCVHGSHSALCTCSDRGVSNPVENLLTPCWGQHGALQDCRYLLQSVIAQLDPINFCDTFQQSSRTAPCCLNVQHQANRSQIITGSACSCVD